MSLHATYGATGARGMSHFCRFGPRLAPRLRLAHEQVPGRVAVPVGLAGERDDGRLAEPAAHVAVALAARALAQRQQQDARGSDHWRQPTTAERDRGEGVTTRDSCHELSRRAKA